MPPEPGGRGEGADRMGEEAATAPTAAGGRAGAEHPRGPSRYLSAFGRFWWEFLIGDTPELFVGMLVVLGIAAGLGAVGGISAVVAVPLAVIALLVASVARGRARS